MIAGTAPEIVVLGTGFGGLEAAGYMRWKLRDANITIISDKGYFLFRPNTIYIPFGVSPDRFVRPLHRALKKRRISFVHGLATDIDPDSKTVAVDGQKIAYDFLVVSTGASMAPEEVPGLAKYAQNIWTSDDMLKLRGELETVVSRARQGARSRILFLVPPNNKCSGPLYEVVMMLDTWLRRQKVRDLTTITWTTYEKSYIQAFGPELHRHVTSEFTRRGIDGHTEHVVNRVEDGKVVYDDSRALEYDLLISFPPYTAAQRFGSLPCDERGFILTERQTRTVQGHDDIFAAGDAGDFPVKQAFLAFLQADTVAANIVSMVQGRHPSAIYVPNSLCVMEEYDKATYAQVPLRETGDPSKPVEVRDDEEYPYRVGTSVVWRAGKWALGIWLPARVGNARPFHAGLLWDVGNIGLKGMAKLFSRRVVTKPAAAVPGRRQARRARVA